MMVMVGVARMLVVLFIRDDVISVTLHPLLGLTGLVLIVVSIPREDNKFPMLTLKFSACIIVSTNLLVKSHVAKPILSEAVCYQRV